MLYDIAGVLVEFFGNNNFLTDRFSKFIKKSTHDAAANTDITIDSYRVDSIDIPDGELILDESSQWYRKQGTDKGFFILMKSRVNGSIETILETDQMWKRVSIRYIKSDLIFPIRDDEFIDWNDYHIFQLSGIAYRNRVISMDSITVHSSSFSIDGKGVIISAPSGTGKSTHTRMWKEVYGERVVHLNDDRPVIRFFDKRPMLCGTPWSGSTDIYENMMVPLDCIVMLGRGPENRIERVDMCNALQLLMPRCFLPYFDEELMEKAISVLEKLVEAVPVYHLECRPDHEAAELVYKCMNL